MHDDLKRRLQAEVDAELGTRPPSDLSEVLRRGRGKRVGIRLMATASMVVVGIGVVAGSLWIGGSLSRDDAAPVPPAEEKEQEGEPMRNGRILQADRHWLENTAPPPPVGDHSYSWEAFDQDTGSFMIISPSHVYGRSFKERVWVVREDGLVAELDCPTSSSCEWNEMDTFGPSPDEITVPSDDGRSAHIIGFDVTLRDTLDISAVTQDQPLGDLAWSPDGSLLAVSTECDLGGDSCGKVWIFDRDGGEPQLVYTESAAEYTVLRDLAWSPDGDTLAFLVGPLGFCTGQGQVFPRLVALRVAPDEPVRAETLNVYDDYGVEKGCVVNDDYHLAFPFAWSPDGTRIAVTSGDGITEISAENGEVLDRHSGEGPEGPLAWLPKR